MADRDGQPEPKAPHPETLRLLYDELRHRHDVQRAVAERLEGKAALLLGAALALVSFVVSQPVRSWWLPAALAFYAGTAFVALAVVVPRQFQEVNPRHVLVGLWRWTPHDAAGELANNRLRAIETNITSQGRRVACLRWSIGFLLAGALMSALHLTLGERDAGGPERAAAVTGAARRIDAGT